MDKIKQIYQKSSNWFLNQATRKYFNEIYAGIILAFALFAWAVSGVAGLTLLVISAIIAIALTFDLKYIVPQVAYILFTLSAELTIDMAVPVFFYILAGLLIVGLIVCNIRNGFKLKKFNFFVGLAGLAITAIIPVFWAVIKAEYGFYYAMYFADLGYFALYILMSNGTKSKALDITISTMSLLPILVSLECAIMVIKYRDNVTSLFDMWYSLGWGLCNEAGIMCCFAMPFIFYGMVKAQSLKKLFYELAKLAFAFLGILLTTSRASYAFGAIEAIVLFIIPLFIADNKKLYRRFFLIVIGTGVVACLCAIVPLINLIKDVSSTTFSAGADSNGRIELWTTGIEKWTTDFKTVIFGPGFCCDIASHDFSYDLVTHVYIDTFTVFHSWLLETLCVGGVLALGFLACHFFEKYSTIFKVNKQFGIVMAIGFAFVEGYGLIDNTYHMYYFMIPLVVVLAGIDSYLYNNNECACVCEEKESAINEECN